MNMNGLINMVIRQVTNALVKRGMSGAMDVASKWGQKKPGGQGPQGADPKAGSTAGVDYTKFAKDMNKRLKDVRKITGRMK